MRGIWIGSVVLGCVCGIVPLRAQDEVGPREEARPFHEFPLEEKVPDKPALPREELPRESGRLIEQPVLESSPATPAAATEKLPATSPLATTTVSPQQTPLSSSAFGNLNQPRSSRREELSRSAYTESLLQQRGLAVARERFERIEQRRRLGISLQRPHVSNSAIYVEANGYPWGGYPHSFSAWMQGR